MTVRLIIVCLIALACEKTPGKATNQERGDISQGSGARVDSGGRTALALEDSGIPKPPKPIEEMDKREREAYIATLQKSGHYVCCINKQCNMCLYNEEDCPCEKAVKNNDPVCGECYRGWQKGKGAVKGIKKEDVRRL